MSLTDTTVSGTIASICEIARGVASRRELHDAWLEQIAPLGFDSALVLDDTCVPGPLTSVASLNLSQGGFARARVHAERYLAQYPLLRARASRQRDVIRIAPQDQWLSFYQEQAVPQGQRYMLVIAHHARGRPLSVVHLTRNGSLATPFGDREVEFAAALGPIMSLGDLVWRQERAAEAGVLQQLANREREVCQLVRRGLTNREIASLLGSSPNTVRNQLSSAFRKLGVSTRAELAGLC